MGSLYAGVIGNVAGASGRGMLGWSSTVGFQSAGACIGGILARGALDCAVAQNSEDNMLVTHFRMTYKATPMFAFDHFWQDFIGCTGFGTTATVCIGRTPDLITNMYVELQIPGISVRVHHDESSTSSTSAYSGSTDPYSGSSYSSYGSGSYGSGSYGSGSAAGYSGTGSYGSGYSGYSSDYSGTGSGSGSGSGGWGVGSFREDFDSLAHTSRHPYQGFANYWDAKRSWKEGEKQFIKGYYSDVSHMSSDEKEHKYKHLLQYLYGQRPPAPTPSSSADPRAKAFCYWTQAVGQFAIKEASIQVGGQTIDRLWGDFLFVWEELSGKAGKRLAEMIGKSLEKNPRKQKEELILRSSENQTLYVPLPFWFSTFGYGVSLPLVSIQFLQIQLSVTFQDLSCLVVKKPKHAVVFNNNTNRPLSGIDMNALLMYKGIFLDGAERAIFAEGAITQLIRQTQRKDFRIVGQQQAVMPLTFNHPVMELIWVIRREHWERRNLWARLDGVLGKDPMRDVRFSINNQPRFGGRVAAYYRLVQPYEFHSHFPSTCIYVYSFSLYPEMLSPSGSLNFSRLDNTEIDFSLEEGLQREAVQITVFATNLNMFNCVDGLAGLSFGH